MNQNLYGFLHALPTGLMWIKHSIFKDYAEDKLRTLTTKQRTWIYGKNRLVSSAYIDCENAYLDSFIRINMVYYAVGDSIMNVLICDDMQNEIKRLTDLLENSGYSVNTVSFSKGADVLSFLRSGKMIDVCFLDIIMPEMNGIDLAKEMRKDAFKGEIVFLSTSKDYGPETYWVKAFGYLLKPPTPNSVREVLDHLEKARLSSDTDGIMVKTKSAARFLMFRDISYVEVINHKVYYRLTDGESVEVAATLQEIAPQLFRDKRFAGCHNSYIVSLNDVSSIIGREVVMQSGVRLPLSKSYSDLKKKFLDWRLGGEQK